MNQHTDFGQKIGGARKDMFSASHALTMNDLSMLNEREAAKFVTKNHVWPKPDYAALVAEGMPVPVAYFTKKVRDAVPAKPSYAENETDAAEISRRQEEYIAAVSRLRAIICGVKTIEDAMRSFSRYFIESGYVTVSCRYMTVTEYGSGNPLITTKLANAMMGGEKNKDRFENYLCREAARKGFLKDKSTAGKTKTGKPAKKNFVPPQLAHIRRDGPDYRNGRNVTGEDYLHTFGFRGGEFGNWMSQNDRQASLNMGYEALTDLADALGIEVTDISLNGTLSIAFGARGHGNAAAHYEPLRKVINLTKLNGAGSLAHEWWHALDDFIGGLQGIKGDAISEEAYTWKPLGGKLVDALLRGKTSDYSLLHFSEYYNHSREMGGAYRKSGGYWDSMKEMAARAFACYVQDRLGRRSDYLIAHAEAFYTPKGDPAFPVGKEREAINAVFDEIIAALIEDGVFHRRTPGTLTDAPKKKVADIPPHETTWDFSAEPMVQLSLF